MARHEPFPATRDPSRSEETTKQLRAGPKVSKAPSSHIIYLTQEPTVSLRMPHALPTCLHLRINMNKYLLMEVKRELPCLHRRGTRGPLSSRHTRESFASFERLWSILKSMPSSLLHATAAPWNRSLRRWFCLDRRLSLSNLRPSSNQWRD